MKNILLPLTVLLIFASCRKDNRQRSFELFYPGFELLIPAGQSPVLPYPLGIRGVNTNIDFYLSENNTDTALIGEIQAFSATLTSLDGLEYNFLRSVSVRICPDSDEACTPADEVFYKENLQVERPGDRITLFPGLRNVKDELTAEEYRLEIVFFLAFPPAFNYDTRLDMTFGVYE